MSAVSYNLVRGLLHYSPETGTFTWRVSRGTAAAGAIAGHIDHLGYRKIGICRRHYTGHRLAWLLTFGKWPEGQLDHKDGNRANNVISNLRSATPSQNGANKKCKVGRLTEFKGVTFHKKIRKWQAQIRKNGKNYYLGCFADQRDAHAAYCAAAERLHGEFARAA